VGPTSDALPKVTPYLLREADRLCPRRISCELTHAPATADPVNRARLRNALLDRIRTWHDTTGGWAAPPELTAEEHAVLDRASEWYAALFPRHHVEVCLPVEEPTELPRRGIALGGWVDLGVRHDDGTHELRQLACRGTPAPRDPLEVDALRLGVLRLASAGWWTRGELTVTYVDLLAGSATQARIDRPDGLATMASWLDARVERLRARAADPTPEPGAGCASCRFVPRCPAHGVRASMLTRRADLVPGVVALSPTSLDAWHRCRRAWRDRALLDLPSSNRDDRPAHGVLVHRLLHLVHRTGSCHDGGHVDEVLTANGATARAADDVRRHVRRCPIGARAVGHEVDWVRAYARPPVFVATARLDAAWDHDGLLDVRDYKTGRVASHAVNEDPGARLQAWVAAPEAAARGLRLVVRYEHLAAEVVEDPEPWEPSDDDLAAIETELAATVHEMRAEREFCGVADPDVCAHCSYHAICDDSAAPPDDPAWPRPDAAAEQVGT